MDVEIRRAEKSDVSGIRALYAQPHAYAGTLQLPFPSQAMWESRFESASENYHNLVAVSGGAVVGQLGLSAHSQPRRKHVAGFGMAVCSSVEGKGVGSMLLSAALDLCDNWLNIERVELEVYTDNERAIRLYQKHGFSVEGEHKSSAFREGRYVDVFSMARLKSKI